MFQTGPQKLDAPLETAGEAWDAEAAQPGRGQPISQVTQ